MPPSAGEVARKRVTVASTGGSSRGAPGGGGGGTLRARAAAAGACTGLTRAITKAGHTAWTVLRRRGARGFGRLGREQRLTVPPRHSAIPDDAHPGQGRVSGVNIRSCQCLVDGFIA